jgi:hypothetical protein
VALSAMQDRSFRRWWFSQARLVLLVTKGHRLKPAPLYRGL